MSLVEAAANVVVGYVLAIATQILIFPLFGIEAGLPAHLAIGLVFAVVSLARGYVLRRLFEHWWPQKNGPAQGLARVEADKVAQAEPLRAVEVSRKQDLAGQPHAGG
ncbi:hypothetical protein RGD00_16705 [Xinfangfangia sp. LG-4]|uniref:Uncharacterized protein n=2 Tax=Ruixingdingia sedimenti TaxID=3073604 RepID=A0ABU1FBI9_9RHOB|nr:hypothetical protein [Xinfangfangia sp. LG-4]MDR5654256.1 hypothetical protein [Xinfangfangia sp. LG-4]